MTCHRLPTGFVCTHTSGFFRLRLEDGRHIFMEWHNYLGPIFFYDKKCTREIGEWWEDPLICKELDWFQGRGNRA